MNFLNMHDGKQTIITMESRSNESDNCGAIKIASENDQCNRKLEIKKENLAFGSTFQPASPVNYSDETFQNRLNTFEISTISFKGSTDKTQSLKERKKLYKKKVADEKKRQREEEYRQKLLPKDQKVTLVNQEALKFLDKYSLSELRHKNIGYSLEQNRDNFPALGAVRSKPKRGEMVQNSCKEHTCSDDSCLCSSTATGQNCEPAAGTGTEGQKDKTVQSKRAHWKSAVAVALLDIAKDQLASKQEEDKKKQKVKALKNSKPLLFGNPLDSSNPERKRGKFRENKKEKVSSLKKIIRNELEKKKQEKAEFEQVNQKPVPELSEQDWDALFSEVSNEFNGYLGHNIQLSSGDVETTQQDSNSETSTSVISFEKNEDTSPTNILIESSATVDNGSLTGVKPKSILHSRKFRDYCDHFVTPEINELASNLIRELLRLQNRQYQRDPIKAYSKQKYVAGLHETRKFLLLKKVKLLIIATDIEKIESAGGLNDLVSQLKEAATIQNVPCVFALQRRKMGYLTLKKSPVSCLGVLNYQACEGHVIALLEAVKLARLQYNDASQKNEVSRKQDDSLEPQPATQSETDEAVKEIIDSFISLVRSETSAENSENSSPFLQAIERVDKS